MTWIRHRGAVRLGAALLAVAGVTVVLPRWLHVSNAATVVTTYLMVVLLVAATSRLWVAVATSLVSMACLNFFFLPPLGTFAIADPQNWVALFAFLTVSLVASNLSAVARARTEEAVSRRDELSRLFDLSRDVLQMPDGRQARSVLAESIARRFDLEFVALALPRDDDWEIVEGGRRVIVLDRRQLSAAFAAARSSLEYDAHARTYAGHEVMTVARAPVRLVPLRVGTKPTGILAAAGRTIEAGTLDALGGLVAIAIERVHLLEERKAAELTRQSEQLKTALLASLSHDLLTPLTAIRVAASNIRTPELPAEERTEQVDQILSDVERLTRLFQNVLEMARIDAGAISTDARWAHPSEIIAAAREQVDRALQAHGVEVAIDPDVPVHIDPRLTATALAHLLENAAQYSAPGTSIRVNARVTNSALVIDVRDRGPGIAPADLPHVFERFYRGSAARGRTSGTGMGLWIVRRLLAAEQGQVRAENCADGGAQFTMTIPVGIRMAEAAGAI